MRDLSLHILDIAENSILAKAKLIKIEIKEDKENLRIEILDNGIGMSKAQLLNASNPFYTTRKTRNVGLGIPLFKMAAKQTGGSFFVDSQKEIGTKIIAVFKHSSIDMIPLGDINSVVALLIRCNPDIDFLYKRSYLNKSFCLDTRDFRLVLEEVPLNSKAVLEFTNSYLEEQTLLILEA